MVVTGAPGRFAGHAGPVLQAVYCPTGDLLATTGLDGTVRWWEAETGEALAATMYGGPAGRGGIAFSADGALLAHTSGSPRAVRLWDVPTRRRFGPPLTVADSARQGAPAGRPAFSPDGALVAAASSAPGVVLIWHLATAESRAVELGGDRPPGTVPVVVFTPDGMLVTGGGLDDAIVLLDPHSERLVGEPMRQAGHLLAVCPRGRRLAARDDTSREVTLWDLGTRQAVGHRLAHLGRVRDAAFSPDGELVACVGASSLIHLWGASDGRPAGEITTDDPDGSWSVAFSPDGTRLVTAEHRGLATRVWDRTSGHPVAGPLAGHTANVFSLAFSPDGRVLATGGPDGVARLWDVDSGQPTGVLRTEAPTRLGTGGLIFSPEGELLGTEERDALARFWEAITGESGRVVRAAPHLRLGVGSLAFSPDGRLLAADGGNGHRILLWDMATGRMDGVLPAPGYPRAVAFSPDGRLLAAGGDYAELTIWNPETGKPAHPPLTADYERTSDLAFSPDGLTLAAATRQGLRLWNTPTWQRRIWSAENLERAMIVYGHAALAFSPDGDLLAADGPSRDGIAVLDTATGHQVAAIADGDKRGAHTLAFSPDGRLLAGGGADGTIRLWDPRTGDAVPPALTGHTSSINRLAFSPDGRLLASCSADRTIRLWDPHTGTQVDGTGWPGRHRAPRQSAESASRANAPDAP